MDIHGNLEIDEALQRNDDLNAYKASLINGLLSSKILSSTEQIKKILSTEGMNDLGIEKLILHLIEDRSIALSDIERILEMAISHKKQGPRTYAAIIKFIGTYRFPLNNADQILKTIYDDITNRRAWEIDDQWQIAYLIHFATISNSYIEKMFIFKAFIKHSRAYLSEKDARLLLKVFLKYKGKISGHKISPKGLLDLIYSKIGKYEQKDRTLYQQLYDLIVK